MRSKSLYDPASELKKAQISDKKMRNLPKQHSAGKTSNVAATSNNNNVVNKAAGDAKKPAYKLVFFCFIEYKLYIYIIYVNY